MIEKELKQAINFLQLSEEEIKYLREVTKAKNDYEFLCELEKIIKGE